VIFKVEEIRGRTATYEGFYAWFMNNDRWYTKESNKGTPLEKARYRRVDPFTVISYRVTAITAYAASSPRYGLDCKVTMEGWPLDYIKARAARAAITESRY
jgi:hypothetical protein